MLGAFVVGCCALALGAEVFTRLGVSSFPLLGATLTLAIGVSVVVVRRRVRLVWSAADLFGLFLAVATTAVVLARVLPSWRWPVSNSVDVAHHFAAVDYIRATQHTPIRKLSFLGEMAQYPQASHVAAAFLSWSLRLDPLAALSLFAILTYVVSAIAVARLATLLADSMAPQFLGSPSAVPGASAIALLIYVFGRTYSLDLFASDFFFGQQLGICVLATTVVVAAQRRRLDRGWIALNAVSCVLLVLSYPPLAVIALLMSFAVASPSERRSRPTRLALVVFVATAVFELPRKAAQSRLMFTRPSPMLPQTIAAVGGLGTILLAIDGLVSLGSWARRWRDAPDAIRAVATSTAALGAMFFGFWLARELHFSPRPAWYSVVKVGYGAFPIGAALCGAMASVRLAEILKKRSAAPTGLAAWSSVAATAACLAVALFWPSLQRRPAAISPDYYRLGRWAVEHLPSGELGEAGAGLGPYIVRIAVDHRDRDALSLQMLRASDPFTSWPSAQGPQWILVDSRALADEYARRGAVVDRRLGSAVLLRRS